MTCSFFFNTIPTWSGRPGGYNDDKKFKKKSISIGLVSHSESTKLFLLLLFESISDCGSFHIRFGGWICIMYDSSKILNMMAGCTSNVY